MRNRISKTELSAYIDGEARDARAVESALEASEDLRRERDGLANVSHAVRSLTEVEPRAGFAQRVIAHLNDAEEAARPVRAWGRPARTLGSLAAAALLAVAVGVGLQGNRTEQTPVATPVAEVADDAAVEAQLMAELERHVATNERVQRVVVARFDTAPSPEALYSERLLAAVAQYDDVAYAGQASGYIRDYRPALRSLDATQTDALKELLAQSVAEGLEG